MSDDNQTDDKKSDAKKNIAPTGVLTRDTDHAARPGFRSPPNAKSKAQKPKKKK